MQESWRMRTRSLYKLVEVCSMPIDNVWKILGEGMKPGLQMPLGSIKKAYGQPVTIPREFHVLTIGSVFAELDRNLL